VGVYGQAMQWEEKEKLLTLGCDSLYLADDAGGDELLEIQNTDVVEETKLELLELETAQVEAIENTELVDLEEGVELLELEERSEVKLVLLEKTLELKDVEVVNVGKVAKETKLKGVDVEQVVKVDLVETLEAIEGVDIKGKGALVDLSSSRGNSRGSGSEGGESRDEDGEDLHFC
jgi:hypothetical protein